MAHLLKVDATLQSCLKVKSNLRFVKVTFLFLFLELWEVAYWEDVVKDTSINLEWFDQMEFNLSSLPW